MNMAAECSEQIYLRCVRLQLITVVVPIVRARPRVRSFPQHSTPRTAIKSHQFADDGDFLYVL